MIIVLTGPSHVGKSTVSAELLSRIPDMAVVKYDQFFFDTLRAIREGQDPDVDDFAIAYELMQGVVRQLVAHGRPTVVESTFTRVSKKDKNTDSQNDSGIYVHDIELQHILGLDLRNAIAVQLFAPWHIIESRLMTTGRLDEWVVKGTWAAHSKPWSGCVRLDADRDPSEIADDIAALAVDHR